MVKEKAVLGYFASNEPLSKFIRFIFTSKNYPISWNLSLPFRITKEGTIKKDSRGKVLDDIRNSYGIDLTADIEIDKDALSNEIRKLKKNVSMIKEIIHSNQKDTAHVTLFEQYQNKLSKFLNRNDTYNKYYLRKKEFDYRKLDRLAASFLITTGQVIYKDDKFVFNVGKNGRFFNVTNFKSFDTKEPFNQRIFETTYYVDAENTKFAKKAKWSFTTLLKENKNVLKESRISFNAMYGKYVITKVKKLYKLITHKDAINILKSLYEFRVFEVNYKKIKDTEDYNKKINSFTKKLEESKNKSITSSLVSSFINCFPNARIKKKDAKCFITSLCDFLDRRYISREEVEKNYVSRKEVEAKYILKEEHERVTKSLEERIKALEDRIKVLEEENKQLRSRK